MNFGKHFNNVKTLRGNGYHHGKRFLGHLDNAYRTGKEKYIKLLNRHYNKSHLRQQDKQTDI